MERFLYSCHKYSLAKQTLTYCLNSIVYLLIIICIFSPVGQHTHIYVTPNLCNCALRALGRPFAQCVQWAIQLAQCMQWTVTCMSFKILFTEVKRTKLFYKDLFTELFYKDLFTELFSHTDASTLNHKLLFIWFLNYCKTQIKYGLKIIRLTKCRL